jgi:hypothetical protein
VPYLIGEFRQFDSLDFLRAPVIEKTEFDLRRMGGEQGKVDSQAIPSRTLRIREALREFVISVLQAARS